jgi:hypothetical protein
MSHALTAPPRRAIPLFQRAKNGVRQNDRTIRRIRTSIWRAAPWLERTDLLTVNAYAELEYLASAAFLELSEQGVMRRDKDAHEGEPKRLLDAYRGLRQTQLQFGRELGLTPAARIAIKATGTRAALDLAAQLASTDDDAREADER